MFQQPILAVENPAVFEPVKAAIEAVFAPPAVSRFLEKAERARLRIRDFDTLRQQGLLGETVKSGYENWETAIKARFASCTCVRSNKSLRNCARSI